MILAAGFGTRLAALSAQRPKPMLPICGVPLVRWAVLWLREQGIREIVINLHHLGHLIEEELGDGRALGVEIAYSREEGQILGTGGGLREAMGLLDDGRGTPIVAMNGKILIELDLAAVLRQHRATGAEATMVLRPDADAKRWGSLRLDEGGRVVEFLEATPEAGAAAEPSTPPLMFTGVHVFDPRFIDRVPREGEQCVVRTAYRSLFHEARGFYGFSSSRYWWEHSTAERYLQGVANVLDGAVSLPYAPRGTVGIDTSARIDPQARVTAPVWIGRDVTVDPGAVIGPYAQIGDGTRVRAGIRVERSIVWDGLDVSRHLSNEVFTGE